MHQAQKGAHPHPIKKMFSFRAGTNQTNQNFLEDFKQKPYQILFRNSRCVPQDSYLMPPSNFECSDLLGDT